MNFKKSNKGITLTALIITIIVMLLLTGVAVWQITSNNGLIQKIQSSNSKNARAHAQEELELVLHDWKIERYMNKDTTFESFMENNGYEVTDLGEGHYKVSKNGYEFNVDSDLKVNSIVSNDNDDNNNNDNNNNNDVNEEDNNQFEFVAVNNISNWNDESTTAYIYNDENGYITYIDSEKQSIVQIDNLEQTSVNKQILKSSIEENGGYYVKKDGNSNEIIRMYKIPAKIIQISYYDNNENLGSKNVATNHAYGDLLQPSEKNGYNFDGWYTDSEFTTLVTSSTQISNQNDHNLYAKWSLIMYTVYFEKPDIWSSNTNVYLHAWINSTTPYKSWQTDDEKMTLVSGNTYSYELPMLYNNILFSTDVTGTVTQSKSQTMDTTLKGNNLTYRTTNTSKIYLLKPPSGWSGLPHAYTWVDGSNPTVQNASWPGVEMTHVEEETRYYSYELLPNHNKIIFNNNAANAQTDNLDIKNLGLIDMLYTQNPAGWSIWVEVKSE